MALSPPRAFLSVASGGIAPHPERERTTFAPSGGTTFARETRRIAATYRLDPRVRSRPWFLAARGDCRPCRRRREVERRDPPGRAVSSNTPSRPTRTRGATRLDSRGKLRAGSIARAPVPKRTSSSLPSDCTRCGPRPKTGTRIFLHPSLRRVSPRAACSRTPLRRSSDRTVRHVLAGVLQGFRGGGGLAVTSRGTPLGPEPSRPRRPDAPAAAGGAARTSSRCSSRRALD